MSYLTHRAERAVLAALLTQPHPGEHGWGLRVEDFSSRLHRDLFNALTDLAARPDLTGSALDRAVAAMVTQPGATAADLAELRDQAPRPEHAASYARLVHSAAIRRDLAQYAERLVVTIAEDDDSPERDNELDRHTRRLAVALLRHGEVFTAITAPGPDAPEDPDPTLGAAPDSPVRGGAMPRSALEDQILADLLRDPEQATDLMRFLPDEAFTSSLRRHIYRTVLTLAHDGEPVDEVTIAWNIELHTGLSRLHGIDANSPTSSGELVMATAERDSEPAPVYLARLAATTLTVASAVHAAKHLLAAHLRGTLPASASVAAATEALHTTHSTAARPQRTTHRDHAVVETSPGHQPQAGPLPSPQPGPQPGTAPAPTSPRIRP